MNPLGDVHLFQHNMGVDPVHFTHIETNQLMNVEKSLLTPGTFSMLTDQAVVKSEPKQEESSSESSPTTESRKQHNCPYCDRSFTRPYRLNDHIAFSHTAESKYVCLICSKKFSCKDKLKYHMDMKHDNKKSFPKTPRNKSSSSTSSTTTKSSEDFKCGYPGCTKTFANKYNVKRHMENVHLKLKRRRSRSSSNDSNSTSNNSSQDNRNGSQTDSETKSSSSISLHSSHNSKRIKQNDVAQIANNLKMEATLTPHLNQSNIGNHHHQQQLLAPTLPNSNNIAGTPLTVLANNNCISGINQSNTLEYLRQQQQHQQDKYQLQQQQQQQPTLAALGLTQFTNGGLVLNGNPVLMSQSQHLQHQHQQQQQKQYIIYQQPTGVQHPMTNSQPFQCLSNVKQMNENFLINLNNSENVMTMQMSQANGQTNFSYLQPTTSAATTPNVGGSVMSIKSEQIHHDSGTGYSVYNNSHPVNANEILQQPQQQQHQNQSQFIHQQIEDEKDAKIYTCARCPEMFTSADLLRNHIAEFHEKPYGLHNVWQ